MIPSSPKAPLHETAATDPTLVVQPPQVDVSGRWDAVLIGTAWIAYAFALTSSNLTLDPARDIAQAYLIATGSDWPLRGPMIGSAVYLGPLWFYLLAPAAVFGSTAVVALWVGLLAGSKFLFGWLLGTAIAGPSAGRGIVVALALPAWTGFELLVFSHTNLVAAAALAFAWGCLELWRAPRNGLALWIVATAVLMLHAHPSMLPWLLLALPGLVRGVRQRAVSVTGLLAPGVVAVSLFLPPWLAPSEGSMALGTGALLPAGTAMVGAPMLAMDLGRALVVEGPSAVVSLVGAWSSAAAAMLAALALAVAVVGVGGLAVQWRRLQRLIMIGLALLLLSLLFIAWVKPQTPFYMAYGPSTLLALLIGLGIGRFLKGPANGPLAVMFLLVLLGTQVQALRTLSSRGVLDVPQALTDIASRSPRQVGPGAEQLSPVAADGLARLLCASPGRVHGPLATALDLSYGIAVKMTCGRSLADLAVGDHTPRVGWLGLPSSAWSAIGGEPQFALRQWGLTRDFTLRRAGVVTWADYRSSRDYPPRTWRSGEIATDRIEVELAPGDVLVTTSLEHFFGHNAPAVLRLRGVDIEPVWRSEWSSVWRPSLNQPRTFSLILSGRSVDAIEVLVLTAPPGGS